MTSFFAGLKSLFEDIPAKTKFLTDLDFSNSYIGFRYFLQGHKEEPSPKFMKKLSEDLGYDYISIPIKRTAEHQAIRTKIEAEFTTDLEKLLTKYAGDTSRTYTKNKKEPSVSEVITAFQIEKDLLDTSKQLDVSDLF